MSVTVTRGRSRNFFHFMDKIAIFPVLISLPVNAGIYKGIDENGNVHYSYHVVDLDKATELIINSDAGAGVTNAVNSRVLSCYTGA